MKEFSTLSVLKDVLIDLWPLWVIMAVGVTLSFWFDRPQKQKSKDW